MRQRWKDGKLPSPQSPAKGAKPMSELNRKFWIRPGYDMRKNTPSYGCHGAEIHFAVVGDKGAISLTIMTDWFPSTIEWRNQLKFKKTAPWVTDVSYHSSTQTEYGTHIDSCKLTGGECWGDGTSMNEAWTEGIINGGSDWLWDRLEARYRHQFEGAEWPDLSSSPITKPEELNP